MLFLLLTILGFLLAIFITGIAKTFRDNKKQKDYCNYFNYDYDNVVCDYFDYSDHSCSLGFNPDCSNCSHNKSIQF